MVMSPETVSAPGWRRARRRILCSATAYRYYNMLYIVPIHSWYSRFRYLPYRKSSVNCKMGHDNV